MSENSLRMHQVNTSFGFQHLSNNHQCYKCTDFLSTKCGNTQNKAIINILVLFQLLNLSGERARSFEFVDDDADTGNYQESPINPITGRFAK